MAIISYNGVTHRPNNAISPDGDLALCLNFVNDNGALTPLEQPSTIAPLPAQLHAIFIHKSEDYKHLITYDTSDNSILWIDFNAIPNFEFGNTDTWGTIINNIGEKPSVTALGNTLIFTFKNHPLQYAVWKNGGYAPLGSHPPFIPIQFALQRQPSTSPLAEFTIPSFSWEVKSTISSRKNIKIENETAIGDAMPYFDEIPEAESQQYLSNAVLGELNKAIALHSTEADDASFIFPFIVRYAIRFYDGSLTQHSYPVLMIPNSYVLARIKNFNAVIGTLSNSITSGNGTLEADTCKLFYKFLQIPDIENWKDLIQGIDVFISAPLYTYDQAGYIKGFTSQSSTKAPFAIRASNEYMTSGTEQKEVKYMPLYQLLLPTKNNETIVSMVEDCALFYKVYSISIDNFKNSEYNNGWTQLPIKGSTLGAITSQEVMTDDYNSHNNKQANVAMIYNSRLNIADISETVTADVPLECQFAYLANAKNSFAMATEITASGKSNKLYQGTALIGPFPRYIFYPSTAANKNSTSYRLNGSAPTPNYYSVVLKEHPGLNGAVYFRGFGDNMPEIGNSIPSGDNSITIHYPNKLYTSNVDNPFTFQPQNINTIGSGNIRALCAATQAISQGQFGAFPLYAFTNEGIWALAVSDTGGWTSIQPVTRDVISEGSIPLSLDNAIAFFSARGLMLLQGSDVSCLSTLLDTHTPISLPDNMISNLPKKFIEAIKSFPKLASLAYDYAHSRIYVLAPHARWIYSIKQGTWSHAEGGDLGDYALNDYPHTIIVSCNDNTSQLLAINEDCEYYSYGEVFTRPIKFGSQALRTIRALVTRGLITDDNDISISLYASMDNNSFIPIAGNGSSADIHRISGSPYRSHCLHLIATTMAPNLAINYTEFEIVNKRTNKLR